MLKYCVRATRASAARIEQETGVPVEEILGRDRTPFVANLRQRVMWEVRQMGHSFTNIGMAMDRDHSTVIHGVRAHEARKRA